jgi:INO80 complex subunit C
MDDTEIEGDFSGVPLPFKNTHWRLHGKKAKNAKALLQDEQRRLQLASIPSDKATYFTVEAPPSLKPHKHWCDITGLEGRYKAVRSGLRYHNVEVYRVIKELAPGVDQQYLQLRNATVVLK